MNRFLTPLTNAILNRKGTIDKYMGDAIMAFWNAPLDDKDHQLNACEAALDMLERVDELNQAREQEAKERGPTVHSAQCRHRLNTGTCVVGNMGSDQRFDYSVFGDSVNLASRLEGQSKEYGFPIIVGSKDCARGQGQVRDPRTRLHHGEGQEGAEVIYAIAGREDTAQSGRFQRLRNLTIEMLACYRAATGKARWPPSRAAARPTRQIRWSCSTDCTRRGSATTSKTRRRKTGTAPSRC
jgi:adenylate cyclase